MGKDNGGVNSLLLTRIHYFVVLSEAVARQQKYEALPCTSSKSLLVPRRTGLFTTAEVLERASTGIQVATFTSSPSPLPLVRQTVPALRQIHLPRRGLSLPVDHPDFRVADRLTKTDRRPVRHIDRPCRTRRRHQQQRGRPEPRVVPGLTDSGLEPPA